MFYVNGSVTIITVKVNITIENPRGIGEVYESEKMISSVHYGLTVEQEINIVETLGGKKELDGLKSAHGVIQTDRGVAGFVGKDRLTLYLQDGRKIDFIVARINFAKSLIEITAIGGFY